MISFQFSFQFLGHFSLQKNPVELPPSLGFISRAETAFQMLRPILVSEMRPKCELRPKCGLGATDESEAGLRFNSFFGTSFGTSFGLSFGTKIGKRFSSFLLLILIQYTHYDRSGTSSFFLYQCPKKNPHILISMSYFLSQSLYMTLTILKHIHNSITLFCNNNVVLFCLLYYYG